MIGVGARDGGGNGTPDGEDRERADAGREHRRDDALVRMVAEAHARAQRSDRPFVAYLLEMALVELLDPSR